MAESSQKPTESLSQESANQLFHHGAILVFLDVPVGTEFGIDYNSWTVGPKFKGVKLIPPGVHFVYYSAVSKEKQAAPRTGFFHDFEQREVLVKKWNPQLEDISDEAISADEQERFEGNKEQLDGFLGAYPYDSYKKWVSLTNHLNADLLDTLLPECGKICAVAQFESVKSTSQSRAKDMQEQTEQQSHDDDDRLPTMHPVSGTQIRFTEIPKKTYPDNASPQDVTKYSLDRSYVLETLLETRSRESDLLGELQFAFICFLIGQVFEGFDQWKKIMSTICLSDEALSKRSQLFLDFITTIHYQVHEIPQDFFVDIVTQNNFLVTVLHAFFDNATSQNTDDILRDKARRFRDHLQRKFKWDFTADAEEDCPVILS